MQPLVSIVVAMDERGAIGHAGGLPWRLPEDLKRFKALTLGKPIVMGRRTWDAIGRPLPGRHNLVVTRHAGLALPGATVVSSLEQAFAAVQGAPEVCIVGGAEIYRLALPYTDVLHVTRVHATVAADTYFPAIEATDWEEVDCERHPADERHEHAYSFVEFRRRRRGTVPVTSHP
jgi:dihydrofolate reductase